jgi:formamidopyrimidine-DNA glycosylase
VGNLYADEALWEAHIHPLRTADSLSDSEVSRLAEAIRHVLEQGIQRRGTSFSNYRDAEGALGENQEYLRVYGRGPSHGRPGQPCPRCGRPIERLMLGQRSSYYCARCQKL